MRTSPEQGEIASKRYLLLREADTKSAEDKESETAYGQLADEICQAPVFKTRTRLFIVNIFFLHPEFIRRLKARLAFQTRKARLECRREFEQFNKHPRRQCTVLFVDCTLSFFFVFIYFYGGGGPGVLKHELISIRKNVGSRNAMQCYAMQYIVRKWDARNNPEARQPATYNPEERTWASYSFFFFSFSFWLIFIRNRIQLYLYFPLPKRTILPSSDPACCDQS